MFFVTVLSGFRKSIELFSAGPNGVHLSSQLLLYQSSYGWVIGKSFCECLGGCAACGLLRKNFHRISGLENYLAFTF
jgi:hypothetical protein